MLFSRTLAFAAVIAGASAAVSEIRQTGPDSIKNTFLIEVDSKIDDASGYVKTFLKEQGLNDEDVTVRTTIHNNYFNGVSIAINPTHDVEDIIKAIPAASNVFNVHRVRRPKIIKLAEGESLPAWKPEGIHALTGVNTVREKLGLTGKGIKVAVIDTGVDYKHAALGGCFGPGCRVSFGYDHVGDTYSADNPVAIEDADPMDDCSDGSHGTHVAGIVGADARNITDPNWASDVPFTGAAPEAILGAYRVFGCAADNTGTDIITAAIYKAAEDGADIINLSLGGGPSYSDGSDAEAATRVGLQGHFVLSAHGNDGAEGIFTAGSPGIAAGGIGIASFDNIETAKPFFTVGELGFQYGLGGNNGSFKIGEEYDIVVNDLTADELDKQDDGSADTPTVDATGKIMLIRWGDVAFGGSNRRCTFAAKAKAVGCILYSNTESVPNIAGSTLVPSLATTRDAGQAIIAAIKAGQSPKIVVTEAVKMFNVPTGGTVSDFSSPGLDQELFIKPDLGGIGGQVYSTISKFSQKETKTPYAVYSGTSMATPYAAGAAALILQAFGRNRPTYEEFRTLLQNTAQFRNKFGTELVDSVSYQGAGLIDVYAAIMSKTVVTPSRLAFNDTKNIKQHYKLTVKNAATVPLSYTVGHQPALQVTPFVDGDDASQPAGGQSYTADYATIRFSRNNDLVDTLNFTLKAGESRDFNVHVQPPGKATAGLYPIYSGYVVVKVDGDKVASVPYAGLVGDWRQAPVWSRKSAAFDNALYQAYDSLKPFGIELAENATATTGVSTKAAAFSPIQQGAAVNLTEGLLVFPVAATTTRIARVDAIFKGKEWKALSDLGIKRQTSLYLAPTSSISINVNPDGTLSESKGSTLIFNPLQRHAPSQGQSVLKPSVMVWNGEVVTNATDVNAQKLKLPAGVYQIRFAALRHFGRMNAPVGGNDYDTVLSNTFSVFY
ncbi:hypothetical protein HDU67_005556 [Dinochytrium kinnereticum]|nr:hypothetical protein HDU67_005556 [Dinochytrium kinnereticum]